MGSFSTIIPGDVRVTKLVAMGRQEQATNHSVMLFAAVCGIDLELKGRFVWRWS